MDFENIVLDCIGIVLTNEGYSEGKINSVLNWNYTEIKDYLEERGIN